MNDLNKIDWSVRFESLLDGRTFITDNNSVLFDENYLSTCECSTTTSEQAEKARKLLYQTVNQSFTLQQLSRLSEDFFFGPDGIVLSARHISLLRDSTYTNGLSLAFTGGLFKPLLIFDGRRTIGALMPVTPWDGTPEKMTDQVLPLVAERAKSGCSDACHMMAVTYTILIKYSPEEYTHGHVKWVKKAAKAGLAQWQVMLGGFYSFGKGVVQDDLKAAKWYKRAADQNYPSAFYHLSVLYGIRRGNVPRDMVRSLLLIEKAIDLGYKPAIHSRNKILAMASPKEIEHAKQLLLLKWEMEDLYGLDALSCSERVSKPSAKQ